MKRSRSIWNRGKNDITSNLEAVQTVAGLLLAYFTKTLIFTIDFNGRIS